MEPQERQRRRPASNSREEDVKCGGDYMRRNYSSKRISPGNKLPSPFSRVEFQQAQDLPIMRNLNRFGMQTVEFREQALTAPRVSGK